MHQFNNLFLAHWLGQECVHAGQLAPVLKSLGGIGSEGGYVHLRGVKVMLPDLLGRLEAIHNGHVAVHENELVVSAIAGASARVNLVPYHSVLN